MTSLRGYVQWQQLFDESVSEIWRNESIPILKNISMMLFTINREIERIQAELCDKVVHIRSHVSKQQSDGNTPSIVHHRNTVSSDHLCDTNPTNEKKIILNNSPEIKKRKSRHKYFRSKLKQREFSDSSISLKSLLDESRGDCVSLEEQSVCSEENLKNIEPKSETPLICNSDPDSSMIQCTPVAKIGILKRKEKISSYLQMNKKRPRKNVGKTFEDTPPTSDPTTSQNIGISTMINYLNEDTKNQNNTIEILDLTDDVTPSIIEDNTSLNSGMIAEDEIVEVENLNEFLAKAQNVPLQLEAAPIVRGTARQKLPGWSCKDCENFYLKQGLNAEALLKLCKCSKHRGMYKPREDTLPGFWNMDIHSQDTEYN